MIKDLLTSCCWYHKGTNFQANHNYRHHKWFRFIVVADTTKVRIFKQITTYTYNTDFVSGCCWYHKGTNFQANHNPWRKRTIRASVVADTTKVRIFKQITTVRLNARGRRLLLLIPQRYEFSSKSQPITTILAMNYCCCWYHKGTNFQANHNLAKEFSMKYLVVADTTKVRIFKQITTTTKQS